MLLKLKSLVFILPIIFQVHAASLAAAESDCADCNGTLVADTGVGSGNLQVISSVTRAVSSINLTEGQQSTLCYDFNRYGIDALKAKAQELGYSLYDIYDHVKCDDVTNADLLKHRASLPTARADLMSFARYYIREKNDPAGLTKIFNTVINNSTKPRGTLLDFIDFYSNNPYLTEQDKIDFAAYEITIRRFGGKRESEL